MIVIMTIESEGLSVNYLPKDNFTKCRFMDKCKLSSHHFPHKIPNCDVICPDYLSQQEVSDSIDTSKKILYNEDIKKILPL
ncbi:hypothetical protein LCGC14_2457500 [marine sediment metagenome]|uniref:Uncharacterized protein n=1 Tax=marine sediment metagenome TaxID=412755 RepID=A0A0F9E865_9ZZZZ